MGELTLSLILSTLLAALALWRKAITPWGTALAWCCSVVITYFAGAVGFAALAATFVCTLVAGKISGKKRERAERALHAKHGARDSRQIACNVGLSAVMALIYGLTDSAAFLCAGAGALAASLADSLASEIGILSKTPPRDIMGFKPVQPGMSGGVSPLGLAMSVLGACVIAAVSLGWRRGFGFAAAIAVAGTAASLADSALGSALQAKYRCPCCGALTEKKLHCGEAGTLERGLKWMDNDTVNFLNNAVGVLTALMIYAVI